MVFSLSRIIVEEMVRDKITGSIGIYSNQYTCALRLLLWCAPRGGNVVLLVIGRPDK